MKLLLVIFKHQLVSFFSTPVTYFCIAAFLTASATLSFHAGQLLEQSNSELHGFFYFHPWLYLFLIPVLSTQFWAAEHNKEGIDFLCSLPITAVEIVVGKFFAAWAVAALALFLTSPIVITVNSLGSPGNMLIACQFFASWLLAGAYLSTGCFICALTCKRLNVFISTLALLLIASGLSYSLNALDHQPPLWIVDSLTYLNPAIRFNAIEHGVLALHDSLYFLSMIIAFLSATTIILKYRKG